MRKLLITALLLASPLALRADAQPAQTGPALAPGQWTVARAAAWYDRQPWLVGCNFLPSTAVNDVEMWHELIHRDGRPYDPAEIELIRRTTARTLQLK